MGHISEQSSIVRMWSAVHLFRTKWNRGFAHRLQLQRECEEHANSILTEDACNQVPEELKLQKAEHGYHQDCYQGFRTLKRHIGQLLQIFVIWLKKNHLGSAPKIILGQRTIWLKKKSSWVQESCNLLKDTKQINAGYRQRKWKIKLAKSDIC